jgi:hypothetical protein
MQRVHPDDLVGYVSGKENWVHLNLPAIAELDENIEIGSDLFYTRKAGELLDERRQSIGTLANTKTSMGSFKFSAQFQQRPIPLVGEIVKWDWFKHCDEPPRFEPGDEIVQSWDTA